MLISAAKKQVRHQKLRAHAYLGDAFVYKKKQPKPDVEAGDEG
jgi:hypothetical protein